MAANLREIQGVSNVFSNLKSGEKLIIGCIHLLPLPNTPFYKDGDYQKSIEKAVYDAKALIEGGANGCLIQTVDRIYPNTDDADYMRVAAISAIGREVKNLAPSDFKVGVQIMWNCITPSLAAARAVQADFTRCTAMVGRKDSPFGEIVADPYKIQNYRKHIGATSIGMIAELSGYHSAEEVGYNKKTMLDNARDALQVGADAFEVFHPDEAINEQMVLDLKEAFPNTAVVLGGGTNIENADRRMKYADCAIVGGCFEKGNWGGNVHSDAVRDYMNKIALISK